MKYLQHIVILKTLQQANNDNNYCFDCPLELRQLDVHFSISRWTNAGQFQFTTSINRAIMDIGCDYGEKGLRLTLQGPA